MTLLDLVAVRFAHVYAACVGSIRAGTSRQRGSNFVYAKFLPR